MHNWWTTGAIWGRHAGGLGTSCGQQETLKVLGSQALCSPSQPTKHLAARGNDEPLGGRPPKPWRTGRPDRRRRDDEIRRPPERRSVPARKSRRRTRSGVAQDGDGRQRGSGERGNPGATEAKVTGGGTTRQRAQHHDHAARPQGRECRSAALRPFEAPCISYMQGASSYVRPCCAPSQGPTRARDGPLSTAVSELAGLWRPHLAHLIVRSPTRGGPCLPEVRGAACARTSPS